MSRCPTVRVAEAAVLFVLAAAWVLIASPAAAQQLEPRSYVASPVGARFVILGVTHSSGDVLIDPSLPIEDVSATSSVPMVGFGGTFGLLGRLASAYAIVPYAWGDVSGRILEAQAQTSRSGLADPVLRVNLHLLGNPALSLREFVKMPRRPIVGISVTMSPPLGQYYPTKLINLGTNRWAFKPEIGLSLPVRRWLFDAYLGVWTFTANHEFYPGTNERRQRPVAALQAHVSYNLKPRAWAAFDATWYNGGRTWLNGVPKSDRQNNARVGATLSLPVGRRCSLKAAYSWDLTTSAGSGFNTLSIGWNIAWFSLPKTQPLPGARPGPQ